jgi:hypothetical protein
MSHPAPALDRARLVQTLVAVLDHALPACAAIDYPLVGTGAALLRGVDLPAGDVDILVKERSAVDALGAALAVFPCPAPPPAHSLYRDFPKSRLSPGRGPPRDYRPG